MKKISLFLSFVIMFLLFEVPVNAASQKLKLPVDFTITIKKNAKKYSNLSDGFGCTYLAGYSNQFVNIAFDGDGTAYIMFNDNPDSGYEGDYSGVELDGSAGTYKSGTISSDEIGNILQNPIKGQNDKEFKFSGTNDGDEVTLKSTAFNKSNRVCPNHLYITTSDNGHGTKNQHVFQMTDEASNSGVSFILSDKKTLSESEYDTCLSNGDCENNGKTSDDDPKDEPKKYSKACYYQYKYDDKVKCATFTFTKEDNAYSLLDISDEASVAYSGKKSFTSSDVVFNSHKPSYYIGSDGSCFSSLYFYEDGSPKERKLEISKDILSIANTTIYEMKSVSKDTCIAKEEEPEKDDITAVCGILTPNTQKFIYEILDWIKYLGLILSVVLGVLDFMKAMSSSEDDAFKKAGTKFGKRIAAVIILFLIPVILQFILTLVKIQGVDPSNPLCTK